MKTKKQNGKKPAPYAGSEELPGNKDESTVVEKPATSQVVTTEKKAVRTVAIVGELVSQSPAYVQAKIGEKTLWFARSSLTAVEIDGTTVAMELSSKLAKRKGVMPAPTAEQPIEQAETEAEAA